MQHLFPLKFIWKTITVINAPEMVKAWWMVLNKQNLLYYSRHSDWNVRGFVNLIRSPATWKGGSADRKETRIRCAVRPPRPRPRRSSAGSLLLCTPRVLRASPKWLNQSCRVKIRWRLILNDNLFSVKDYDIFLNLSNQTMARVYENIKNEF